MFTIHMSCSDNNTVVHMVLLFRGGIVVSVVGSFSFGRFLGTILNHEKY